MSTADIHDVLVTFIGFLGTALIVAVIIRSLLSWFAPNEGTGLSRVLGDITDPILAPIRRVLPPVGGIDFSPILAIVVIQLLTTVLTQLVPSTA